MVDGEAGEHPVEDLRRTLARLRGMWCVRHQLLGTRHALKVLLHAHTAMRRRLLQEGRL